MPALAIVPVMKTSNDHAKYRQPQGVAPTVIVGSSPDNPVKISGLVSNIDIEYIEYIFKRRF